MKTKLLLAAIVLLGYVTNLSAQYCGTAGGFTCPSTNTLGGDFLLPSSEVPCAVRNTNNDIFIPFKNMDTMYYNGTVLTIDSMRIDGINNLPNGLCWTTSVARNTIHQGGSGCIRITGNTADATGQYKLEMLGTLYCHELGPIGPNMNMDEIGARLYIRLKNSASALCPDADTTQTSNFQAWSNSDSIVQIVGKVYFDANTNNTLDTGEAALANVPVEVGNVVVITNAHGDYKAYVDAGIYNVTPEVPIAMPGLTYPVPSISVSATNVNGVYPGINFGATLPADSCYAQVSIVNTGMPPRPGFSNNILLSVTNILSPSPLSATIRFYYDTVQYNIFASIPGDTSLPYFDWQVNNLAIGATTNAYFDFITEIPTPLQTILHYRAEVLTSTCQSLHGVILQEEEVVGSYDPNDKAVSPVGYGSWNGVNPDKHEEFTYKIRFQNTGTFLAEKVVIVDTISQHLDLRTLKVLNASHNYEVEIGNERAVKFIFNNIMLPDSTSNEPGSHGYVQYSIKPYAGLAQNVEITNRADIYFDFNSPILTNTTLTTIDYVDHTVGVKEVANGYRLSIYPNPTNSSVQVNIDERLLGETLTLSDISGRVLLSTKIEKALMQLDMASYASGVYIVRTGNIVKKVVKE